MAVLVYILALVLSMVAADDRFPCNLLEEDRLQQTRMDFQINTGSNTYKIGGQVQVKLGHHNLAQSGNKFRFIIQANKQGSLETVGSWATKGEMSTQCDLTNQNNPDTMYVIDTEVTNYTVTWNAPSGDKTGDALDVEFFVIFMDADDNRHGLLSIGMSPQAEIPSPVEPVVVPDEQEDEKLHNTRTEDQLKMDAQKKKADEIDAENQASEDDWNKKQVEEMRLREEEMHNEEMEYEALLRQEEETRLAGIRAEIKDKEEFDRLQSLKEELEEEMHEDKLHPGDQNEIEIGKAPSKVTGGSANIVGGVSCLILLILQTLL